MLNISRCLGYSSGAVKKQAIIEALERCSRYAVAEVYLKPRQISMMEFFFFFFFEIIVNGF